MPLFYCIHCGQYIDADEEISGMEGNCPRCEGVITVPGMRRQLPQVVIQKLEPPAMGSGASPEPGPSFVVYEPAPEVPAESAGAAAAPTSARRVVIKELSSVAAMVPELVNMAAAQPLAPTERLTKDDSAPPGENQKPEPPAPDAAPPKAETSPPLVTISLTPAPAPAAEAKPVSEVLAPTDPPASPSSPEAISAAPAHEALAKMPTSSSTATAQPSAPAASPPAESSAPRTKESDGSIADSAASTATPESLPAASPPAAPEASAEKPRVPSWKPRPYVEPQGSGENGESVPKRRKPFLPASAVGMAWLVGGALWQVGLMLVSGPDSLIREKCRDNVMFLFATYLASAVMAGAVALLCSSMLMPLLRATKGKAFLGPVFCVVVIVLGIVFLAAGLVWHEHGLPWLQ
jgi:hypothetical protein